MTLLGKVKSPVALLTLLLAGGLLAGCTRGTPAWFRPAPRTVKPERVRYSYVVLADLRAADQLGPGWYEIENGAFRWIARQATVYLKQPESPVNLLEVNLYLPENLLHRVGPPTLSLKLDGKPLVTERLEHAGEYLLKEPIPTGFAGAEIVRLDLELDRAMSPSSTDQRELGLVVTALGFRPARGGPTGKAKP